MSLSYGSKQILLVWIFGLCSSIHIGGTAVILPFAQSEFEITKSSVAWLLVIYFLSTASFMLVAAHLGNAIGRRKLIIAGLVIDTIAITWQFFMPSFFGLIILRLIGGIGNSMIVANMWAVTVSSFPDAKRGQVLGLINLGMGVSMLVSMPIAGIIADSLGWRYLYLLMAIPYGILIVGVTFLTKESSELSSRQLSLRNFDYPGFILMTAFLSSLTIGMQRAGTSNFGFITIASFLLVIVFAVSFVLKERQAKYPVLPITFFNNAAFSTAVIGLFAFTLMRASLTFLLPFYFVEALGWSAAFAGTIFISMNAAHPLVAPLSGILADKIGAPKIIFTAFIAMIIGSSLIVIWGESPPISLVVLSLIVVGVAFGLFAAPNQKIIYDGVPRDQLSLAPGLQVQVHHGSNAIGSAFGAMLLGFFLSKGLPSAFQFTVLTMLIGFLAVHLLMLIGYLITRNHKRSAG